MKDQTSVPKTPDVKTPEQMLQDVKHTVSDTANSVLGEGTVDNLKQTATQVAGTVGQVTNVVSGQVENLSQKIGGQELVWDMKDIITPMQTMIVKILKIAFFIDGQKRISRGQYIIGSLAVVIIMGLFVSILSAIVGPMGVWWWLVFIVVPLINLAVKRFHDLNKPARWALSVLVPFVGWVMPALFTGVNENNPHGPDPLADQPTDLTGYIITALSLVILSSIVVTILWFLWIRVSEPDVDVTDPNMIGEQIGWDTATNTFQQPVQNTTNSATNTVNEATNNTIRR